ncbi:hypothetical protein FNV43_RR14178 [Rhamnella rubrinervis]|uniref:DUF7950 domain-containing protein n=1 Tax=Rhamnella rubrinervis TaxID=2594499 RepID=A0A8K0MFZ9_9ROSA|nr:hypothetical protein FNV43_RR14178 [Rhamnella rubrinervis]
MDSDGWRMIRCTSGLQDRSVINHIMLRFRPIAPKPATGADVPGGLPVDSKNLLGSKGRTKRKYVRVRRNSGYARKKTIAQGGKKAGLDESVATLQLLPEKSDLNLSIDSRSWCDLDPSVVKNTPIDNRSPPMALSEKKPSRLDKEESRMSDQRGVAEEQEVRVVESWVTVEYVTGKCMDGVGFGSTDVERLRNLDGDTYPGFVSDGMNRVRWVNGAFKRMVRQQGQESWDIRVWLVMKEKLPYGYSSFSCHVKLQYWWGRDKYSRMMPCDVCWMDGGGFAWRLDVGAALTLGR